MVKPTKLRPKDLQPGDSIRVTFTEKGVLATREGVYLTHDAGKPTVYYNTEGGILFTDGPDLDVDIELLARADEEPTGLGAVIKSWDAGRAADVFFVHTGDHAWVEAGVPTLVYAWADIAAPSIVAEGVKP